MTPPPDEPSLPPAPPSNPPTLPNKMAAALSPADAQRWEKIKPGTVDRILATVEKAEAHDRRMDWAEIGLRALGAICGVLTVSILALISKYCVDHNAATAGAGIFGAGAATIVTAFITTTRGKGGNPDRDRKD
ncbi:hypothetical protein ACFXHA_03330 [Nocardia sp. NPDC059240]|uniref:hypothetical protein n=1 Tax=Nocardia sp. NPDC059240 TaxID=3346786 RepID=UPI0036A0C451